MIFRFGAVLMLVGAATFLVGGLISNVLFVIGSLMFVAMQCRMRYDGGNFVIARLRRQQLLGALAIILSSCCMTSQTLGHQFFIYNEWVVCLLIGAILELYTSFRIPAELEKEKRR